MATDSGKNIYFVSGKRLSGYADGVEGGLDE